MLYHHFCQTLCSLQSSLLWCDATSACPGMIDSTAGSSWENLEFAFSVVSSWAVLKLRNSCPKPAESSGNSGNQWPQLYVTLHYIVREKEHIQDIIALYQDFCIHVMMYYSQTFNLQDYLQTYIGFQENIKGYHDVNANELWLDLSLSASTQHKCFTTCI